MQPKKTKFRKQFRGRMKGSSISGSRLEFGEYGLKSLGRGWFKDNQIEAARKAITHFTKRNARLWIKVFPDKPISKKSPGSPMGAGKGDVDTFVAVVKPGRILFEVGGVTEEIAVGALKRAAQKLPFPTKIVKKD
jgi:large subunit ribosomal protein L16